MVFAASDSAPETESDGNDARVEAAYREAVNYLVSRRLVEASGDTDEQDLLPGPPFKPGDSFL
jgi:hypothetical protein